ncbi:hypothetical protein DPMN_081749 [Dreissena polymorpha]|uniref:Uncharacterized protein n=1 Tax=Dreissena polymorpha TaxID=45954 RepID=A0A9D3Y9K6_DREPO|nr:hypothetical protein DPMN_081749 [Dreissena polymorpha]
MSLYTRTRLLLLNKYPPQAVRGFWPLMQGRATVPVVTTCYWAQIHQSYTLTLTRVSTTTDFSNCTRGRQI